MSAVNRALTDQDPSLTIPRGTILTRGRKIGAGAGRLPASTFARLFRLTPCFDGITFTLVTCVPRADIATVGRSGRFHTNFTPLLRV
jgi:hypothetical protein